MNEEKIKNELIKKNKLLTCLSSNQKIEEIIFNVKLYTSDFEGKNWLYSDLEGTLIFVLDYKKKHDFFLYLILILLKIFFLMNYTTNLKIFI